MLSGLTLKRSLPFFLAAATAVIAAAGPAIARDRKAERAVEPAPTLNGPAVIAVVSIKDQRISLYDADGGAVRARISSGQSTYETPVGVFSILQKKEEHYSNLYDDASMPFMQRITWSGVALHAGALPGYPASHGCVRLPYEFAQRIFPMTKLGMRVVISRDDIAPAGISHPLLLKPEPVAGQEHPIPIAYETEEADAARATILEPDVRKWPARQGLLDALADVRKVKVEEAKAAVEKWEALNAELKALAPYAALIAKREKAAEVKRKAEARVAKAAKTLLEAKNARAVKRAEKEKADADKALASAELKLSDAVKAAEGADERIKRIKDAIAEAEIAKNAAVAANQEERRKALPISVFVSLKAQKLYVRQANEPVFDTPITIADPDRPIGTHVFTALDYAGGGDDVRWNVVSISRRSAGYGDYGDDDERPRNRKKGDKVSYAPPLTNTAAAAAALERVEIPADVRARISKYVWPGSSLIISDDEFHKETGTATDFILVENDEPHGALAKRKRQPPPSYYFDYYDDYYYYKPRPGNRPFYRYDRRRPPPPKKGLFGWW